MRLQKEVEKDMKEAGEEESMKVGLSMEDVLCCLSKWIVSIDQIATRLR